jgi:hypothetical protein
MTGPWLRLLLAAALLLAMLTLYFAGPESFGLDPEATVQPTATPAR